MKKAPCIFCTVLENGQQKTTVRVEDGSIPVSIMLTLQTYLVGFCPIARWLIVTLQAKSIIANIGDLKAQTAVDFAVIDGTKPLFRLCCIASAEYHAS